MKQAVTQKKRLRDISFRTKALKKEVKGMLNRAKRMVDSSESDFKVKIWEKGREVAVSEIRFRDSIYHAVEQEINNEAKTLKNKFNDVLNEAENILKSIKYYTITRYMAITGLLGFVGGFLGGAINKSQNIGDIILSLIGTNVLIAGVTFYYLVNKLVIRDKLETAKKILDEFLNYRCSSITNRHIREIKESLENIPNVVKGVERYDS